MPIIIKDKKSVVQESNEDTELIGCKVNVKSVNSISLISDFVNDNLIAFRYGTMASMTLLFAYGSSKTALFYRFRTVLDIPPSFFRKRRTIHGRIVHVMETGEAVDKANNLEKPITCLVRHLSPMGRLLHRPAFNFFTRNNPRSTYVKFTKGEDKWRKFSRDLLKVELG